MHIHLLSQRLITGSHNGSVRVWNFSNGQCLNQLVCNGKKEVFVKSKQIDEITSTVYVAESGGYGGGVGSNVNRYILCSGWGRRVYVFQDGVNESLVQYHSYCMPPEGKCLEDASGNYIRGHQDDGTQCACSNII